MHSSKEFIANDCADRGVICAVQALQVVLVRVFLRELPAIRGK